MITGFNTDIDYKGVTYHVQTEDKGLTTPLILSLVYDRGTILASKRSPYDDLLSGEFDEKILIERLQKQHRLICAAIQAGRIEDLKRMTLKESATRRQEVAAQKDSSPVGNSPEASAATGEDSKAEEIPIPDILKKKSEPVQPPRETVWNGALRLVEEQLSEVVEVPHHDEIILPAEAVEIIEDFDEFALPSDNRLKIELLNETPFKGGERKTITIMVRRGSVQFGSGNAQILVKVVGSSFRPLIFHAQTDRNGIATVHLQLPHFKTGRAAILIKTISEGEEAELHRIIQQG